MILCEEDRRPWRNEAWRQWNAQATGGAWYGLPFDPFGEWLAKRYPWMLCPHDELAMGGVCCDCGEVVQ